MTNQRSPEEELQLNSARVQEEEHTCVVVYDAVLEFGPRGENCQLGTVIYSCIFYLTKH